MITIGFDYKRINNEYYEVIKTNPIIVDERQTSGRAELKVTVPSDQSLTYIKLGKENDKWLLFADNAACCDGIIVQINSNDPNSVKVFIFELKSKMSSKKWSEVLNQFRGSILRSLSFCTALGIKEIREIDFFTAYTDSSSLDKALETREAQRRLKGGIAARKQPVGANRSDIDQWRQPVIQPFSKGQMFSHKIIQLNTSSGINKGTITVY